LTRDRSNCNYQVIPQFTSDLGYDYCPLIQGGHLALPPFSGVVGEPAGASVVRGGLATCVGEPACPRPPPSVSAADFSALYERCMESGLKARVAFNYVAGLQTVTVTCILPASPHQLLQPGGANAVKGAVEPPLPPPHATASCVRSLHHQLPLPQPARTPLC
jgi:hypothetical protein